MYFTRINSIPRSRMHAVLIYIWRSIDDDLAFYTPANGLSFSSPAFSVPAFSVAPTMRLAAAAAVR